MPTIYALPISQNVEKQALNMIKGKSTNEFYGGTMYTKEIIFFRKCWKKRNSKCQSDCVPTECSALQNKPTNVSSFILNLLHLLQCQPLSVLQQL